MGPGKPWQRTLIALGGAAGFPEGPAILRNLETLRFSLATGADYEVVRTFMTTFEKRVRPARQG